MRKDLTNALLALFLLTAASAALAACNAVRGAGEDMERGSDTVQQHMP